MDRVALIDKDARAKISLARKKHASLERSSTFIILGSYVMLMFSFPNFDRQTQTYSIIAFSFLLAIIFFLQWKLGNIINKWERYIQVAETPSAYIKSHKCGPLCKQCFGTGYTKRGDD